MEKKKKIIIVGPAWPYRGGIADFNERLAKELTAIGHEVSLVTFTLQYPGFLFPGKTQYSESPAPGLRITRMLNSCNPVNWFKVGRALRRECADIIIFAFWMPYFGPALGTVARMAAKSGAIRIGLMHNVLPHEKKVGDKVFSRYFCKGMDAFLSLSDAVLRDLDSLEPLKPRVMQPHPLYDNFGLAVSREDACARLGLDPEYRYFLFFGLIRAYKGLDLLLEALCDKRFRSRQDFKLIVAGEFYGDGSRYTDFVTANSLENKVIWQTHFIAAEEVKYWFCASDLVIQPYRSATQSGIAQIAYNFDKPLLVTRVGGLPEIVPDGRAGYVTAVEPGAIADAMAHYMTHTPDFSEGIAEVKRKCSWTEMANAIVELQRQCKG